MWKYQDPQTQSEPYQPEPPPPNSAAPSPDAGSIWSTVPIEDDVPLPLRIKTRGILVQEALDRLTMPGQSFAVPADTPGVNSLAKFITHRHNTTPQRYRTYKDKPTNMLRVWRVA